MDVSVTVLGALTALVVAIVLILRKVPPAYGMMIGALAGGVVGGIGRVESVNWMMEGAKGMIPAGLRILAAGVLAGVGIDSGGAKTIAETVSRKGGETRARFALACATMV
ncbi:GntP family permease, partial [Clostridium perfringens]